MAVLQNIRVKFGVVISIIIALALLSFIIDPGTLETALNSMSSKYDVGQIAGKSISYTDFQADIERYTTVHQIMTGSSVQNEQTQIQIRDAAWQELLDRFMFIRYAKDAGLDVGAAEKMDLITGSHVAPIIAQNPIFADENGVFSADKVREFVQYVNSDQTGQYRTYWDYLQNSVYTQAFYAKYGALLTSSDYLNAIQKENLIAANNTTADLDFVVSRYDFADSTITVSTSEIKKFYDSHKEMFKQQANRDIEYVVFEVVPSAEDIAASSAAVNEAYEEFSTTDNMKAFLLKNSDRQYSSYWYRKDELTTVSAEVNEFVNGAKAGEVSPIYQNGNVFRAVRVLDVKKLPETISVRVIPVSENEPTDSTLAVLASTEPMEMTQTRLIPGCEVLFEAAVGKPQIIKTLQYGNILAELVSKSELVEKKQVAFLEKETIPSKETINGFYAQANKFSSIAGDSYQGYVKAVDSLGVYSHRQTNVMESTSTYGAVDQAKEITRWVFDNKKGKTSNIITVNNNYFFVVTIKEVRKEGYASIDDVKSSIHEKLHWDKLKAKAAEDVKAKIAGMTDLSQIAQALGSEVTSRQGVSFSTRSAAAVDPVVLGAGLNAEQNTIVGPVAGASGVYVFKLSNKETGAFYTEEDANMEASQRAQYSFQMLLPVMMKEAGVKDNRARFF